MRWRSLSFASLVAAMALGGCATLEFRREGRLAFLASEAQEFGLSVQDQATIEANLAPHGHVRIRAIEITPTGSIKVTSETFRSVYPIYWDFFSRRDGMLQEGPEEGMIMLSPFGGRSDLPNPRPPETTPARRPAVAP